MPHCTSSGYATVVVVPNYCIVVDAVMGVLFNNSC